MVVMDSRSRRDGAIIEELGWYNPIDVEHSFSLTRKELFMVKRWGAKFKMPPINYLKSRQL